MEIQNIQNNKRLPEAAGPIIQEKNTIITQRNVTLARCWMQQEVLVGEQAEIEEDFTNVLLVLIMYRGQTSWSAAVGIDIYSWGRNCMRLTTQGFCSQQGDELWGFLVTGSKTHWEVSMQWSLKPTVWRK